MFAATPPPPPTTTLLATNPTPPTTTTTYTTSPTVQLLHDVHESSESENMDLILVLRRFKRRLFLKMIADAQSAQALEEAGAPKTPETPVKLAPQEFQKMLLVGLMKPIRPLAARPVQKVSNGAVAIHESSESENMNLIRVLRRFKRRLFLKMVADAQSFQTLEEVAPQTPETPVKLAPQEFQKMPLVGLMKPIRPLAARPVQKVFNGAVAIRDLEPATFQSPRAQAA
jgi:hypothetical protein